jgi:hypothetical protein
MINFFSQPVPYLLLLYVNFRHLCFFNIGVNKLKE